MKSMNIDPSNGQYPTGGELGITNASPFCYPILMCTLHSLNNNQTTLGWNQALEMVPTNGCPDGRQSQTSKKELVDTLSSTLSEVTPSLDVCDFYRFLSKLIQTYSGASLICSTTPIGILVDGFLPSFALSGPLDDSLMALSGLSDSLVPTLLLLPIFTELEPSQPCCDGGEKRAFQHKKMAAILLFAHPPHLTSFDVCPRYY
jgi:hypothetical protein